MERPMKRQKRKTYSCHKCERDREFFFEEEDDPLYDNEINTTERERSLELPPTRFSDSDSSNTPQTHEMARSADNKSALLEELMVPLRWAQFIGCKDKDRLQQLAERFFAMETSFNSYKEQIIEFVELLKLQSGRIGNTEQFQWIYNPPDLENDEIFYANGKSLPLFETTYSTVLQTLSLDKILEDSIRSCNRYKREIQELLQKMNQLQDVRAAELPKQISEEEKIEEMRRFCLENLKSYKGLVFVQGVLRNELQCMKNKLEVSPPTKFEIIFEDTEELKSYEHRFQGSIQEFWKTIPNATVRSLLQISAQIVGQYRFQLERTRSIVTKMKKMRETRQVTGSSVHYHNASPPARSKLDDLESTFQRAFIMWKGMTAIHNRLGDIFDKTTSEISMDIEICEEETGFDKDDFVYNIGNDVFLECPVKWQDLSTLDRYNIVNADIYLEYKALRDTVERMAQTLQHKRKTRQTLQYCHQKWKGLVLMHRVFTEQKKMISQLESALIQPTEEENYFENEHYIMDYVHQQDKGSEEQKIKDLKLPSFHNEKELTDTLEHFESECIRLIEEGKKMIHHMSSIRNRISGIDLQQVQEDQSLLNEIEKLKHEKKTWAKTHEEIMKRNQQNCEQLMDKHNREKQQWEEERRLLDKECKQLMVKKDEKIKKLKESNNELQETLRKFETAYQQKVQEHSQDKQFNASEIEKRNNYIEGLQKTMAEHKQHIKELETMKVMTQNKLYELESEKEKLLTRLSKIAGSKLTQGNAAITDLSDADRPMKIAEKYSELYDNEWTDALEELLDNGATDDQGICILLQIVTEAFEFCSNTAQKYQEGMIQSATCLPNLPCVKLTPATNTTQNVSQLQGQNPSPESDSLQDHVQLSSDHKQALDDLRKALSPQLLHLVQTKYDDRLNEMLLSHFGEKNYSSTPQSTINSSAEREESVYCQESGKNAREEYDKNLRVTNVGSGTKMRTKSNGTLESADDHPSTFDNGMQQRPNNFNTLSQMQRKQGDNLREVSSVNPLIHTFGTGPSNSNQYANFQYSNVQHTQEDEIKATEEHESKEEAIAKASYFEKTKEFAKKCVNLCWLMGIKDPPLTMMFDVPKRSKMNTDWFKHYTQSGNLIKFLVWPALFLYKDGALLAKGVAQPLSKDEEQIYV